jgi:hypothetical protein
VSSNRGYQHQRCPLLFFAAAVVSFAMGLGACCIYLLIDATAVSQQLPSAADVKGELLSLKVFGL